MHRQSAGAYDELGIHVRQYTLGEIRRGNAIHGYGHRPAQHAAKESTDPFCAVIAPEQHSVAFADAAGFQFARKSKRQFGKLAICPAQGAKPATVHIGNLASACQVQLRIFGQGLWHLSLKYRFRDEYAKRQSTTFSEIPSKAREPYSHKTLRKISEDLT